MKTCSRCGMKKPADTQNFYPDKRSRDGLTSACRPCMNEYHKSWRATHK